MKTYAICWLIIHLVKFSINEQAYNLLSLYLEQKKYILIEKMYRRRRTFLVFFTSASVAAYGLHRLINHLQRNESDRNENDLSLKLIETKLNLSNDLLKNKDANPYISSELTDNSLVTLRYNLALQYIKQIHSTNNHIRERGLSHLAKLKGLPNVYYTLLGQQLDYHSAIQLARTYEANSNLFPTGPPYIFSIGKQKVLATDNVNKVNDDDVLLHTLREFLDKLIDEKNRPLDILSQHYLKLVNKNSS